MRPFFIIALMVLLSLSGITQAQQPPAGPPPNGGAGRPPAPPPNGGQQPPPPNGGQQQPPPPNGGQQQPPPPNGGGQQPPPPNGNGQQPPPPPPNGGQGGPGFPADYASSFLLYAVVDRPDNVTRMLYIDPDSLAAMQTGQPLPDGTQIVIEAYNAAPGADGRLVAGDMIPFIHVMEQNGGQWRFASFTPNGAPADRGLPDERPRACVDCHNDTRGFVFTRPELNAFATTGVTQYTFCGETGRDPCN